MSNLNQPNLPPSHSNGLPTSGRKRFRLSYISAAATGCSFLVCTGCCFLASFFLKAERLEGPKGADQVASRMIDWQLLPEFTGDFGATADYSVLCFNIARFNHKESRGILVIAQTEWRSWQHPQGREMTQDLIERFVPDLRKLDEQDCETRKMTIRGLPATFKICRGEDLASTTKLHQVKGQFRGKSDDVLLVLQFEDGFVSDQELDAFLQSIH